MRFNGVCLVTPNVKRLRDFYQDVLQVAVEGELDFVSFSTEGIELSIFLLKIASASTNGPDKMAQMQEKLEFVNYLAENGVRVSRPINSTRGKWVELIETDDGHYLEGDKDAIEEIQRSP